MKTKSGTAISTSFDITPYERCTIRSSVWPIAMSGFTERYASQAKNTPSPMSVNAVG